MMKWPKVNTLKYHIFFITAIMTCVLIILLGISIIRSFITYKISEDYILRNEITSHLNSAAIWQDIERGYGAIIIGSGEGDSSSMFTNFLEAAEKGDAEVLQADKKINILLSTRKNEAYENKLNSWIEGYEDLVNARPRIAYKNISKYEWLEIATHNINNEFNLRDITFIPQREDEEILYLNNVLLPNITELCEYAGLERALIGDAIASGKPLCNETINSIKHYRSVVERSLEQVLHLKEIQNISSKMKQAIEAFDKDFIQEYQLLREEVISSDERQKEEVNNAKEQIAKKSRVLHNSLFEISSELLNMSIQEDVIALSIALMAEEDIHLSERLITVENMFKTFSQIERIYIQIRFLDKSGYERVRVDYDGDNGKIISGSQLQDKSDRYYFKKTLNLLPGEIYTSILDLNMEHGSIENLHKRIVCFATPVFADGKHGGVIAFNMMANNLFFLHKETDNEGNEDYILADQNGFYLHHPVGMKEWGMTKLLNESPHNIRQDYPDVAEEILSGRGGSVHLVSGNVIVYEPLFLNMGHDNDNFWVIIKQIKGVEYPVSASTWFDKSTKAINTGLTISNVAGVESRNNTLKMNVNAKRKILFSLIIIVSAIIVFTLFIWWIRYRVLKPIQKLNLTTQNIIKGNLSYKSEISSSDEIGELAINFNKMTEELINAKRDWESTFNSIGDIITLHDKDNRLIRFNTALTSCLNIKPEYNAAKKYYDYAHNKEDILFETHMKEASQAKEHVMIEVEMPDIGSIFSLSSFPRFNNNGEFAGTVQVMRDITERKVAEDRLREINRFNESLIRALPFGMNIVDKEGNVLYMSEMYTNLFGKKFLGQKCWSLYRDNKKQCELCPLNKGDKVNENEQIVTEGILGGNIFNITHVDIIYKGEKAILEIFNDITDLKHAENKLRSSNRDMELILSSMSSIIIKLSNDYRVNNWNSSAESNFGITTSDVIGRPFRECNIQWDWDTVIQRVSLCQKTKNSTWLNDFEYKRPDGNYGFLSININPIIDEENEMSGLLLMMMDITKQKNLEQILVHTQKMESIGQLAAGIAHEINTPMQFVSDNTFFLQDAFVKINTLLNGYSHLLEMNKAGSVTPELINEVYDMVRDVKIEYLVEEIPEAIKESQDGLKRVTEIVQSMKTFSHPNVEEKVFVDINEMIKSTITVSRNEWKYVADLETDFDINLPSVPCYPGEFNQVILNIIINASHSISEVSGNGGVGRGKIGISTHRNGDWAEIHISDTGAGIPEEIRSRIFEPFFTTKEVGKGTGQGLSIAHSVVVKKHNGKIDFVTEMGKGTKFIIQLPINQLPSKREESHEEANTFC